MSRPINHAANFVLEEDVDTAGTEIVPFWLRSDTGKREKYWPKWQCLYQ